MPPDVHLTSSMVWTCTGILVVVDVLLCMLAWRLVSREHFSKMRGLLAVAGGVFFLLVWAGAMLWAWDWFYVYIFPPWMRPLLSPIFGLSYALIAWAMTWLSLKLKGSPAVAWCVLGGMEGLISHIYAVFGLGAASKPPIMQGTDPFAVLIFAFFELAFYWSLILLFCWFLSAKIIHRSGQDKFDPYKSASTG